MATFTIDNENKRSFSLNMSKRQRFIIGQRIPVNLLCPDLNRKHDMSTIFEISFIDFTDTIISCLQKHGMSTIFEISFIDFIVTIIALKRNIKNKHEGQG